MTFEFKCVKIVSITYESHIASHTATVYIVSYYSPFVNTFKKLFGGDILAFELMNINSYLSAQYPVANITDCNDFTAQYGLSLTSPQALELVQTWSQALKENGRIEFGSGIIEKIITEFCDSPFLTKYNYAETLHELVETFYYYKNETLDILSDDELISYMHLKFDTVSKGSLTLLTEKELVKMATNVRFGRPLDYAEEDKLDADEIGERGELVD